MNDQRKPKKRLMEELGRDQSSIAGVTRVVSTISLRSECVVIERIGEVDAVRIPYCNRRPYLRYSEE